MRPIHWRFEYRNKKRQHVLLAGNRLWIDDVRLELQSHFLLSGATSVISACSLTELLLPEVLVVGPEIETPDDALLLIERVRRYRQITRIPVMYVSADSFMGKEAIRRGATDVIKINKSAAISQSLIKFLGNEDGIPN